MDAKVLELRIPADTRFVAVVRRGVRNLAESVGFTGEDVSDMELAVSEAVTNSVEHGTPDGECGVVVKCHASRECVVVEVEDRSSADAFPACPPAPGPAGERGRGVLMMHRLMDECEGTRTETGTKVRMAKQKCRV